MEKKKYRHLSKEERYTIYELNSQNYGVTEISFILGRSKSSISNELSRNSISGKYIPCIANDMYQERLHQSNGFKIDKHPELVKYVSHCLRYKKWSPDAISGRIALKSHLPNVSSEAIYNWIYNSPAAQELQLYKHLPTKRKVRLAQGTRKGKKISIPNRTSIHQREKIANEKKEIGHYEGDLTFHKGNKSMNIGVIVDKMSQKVFLTLNRCKKSLTVTSGFANRIKSIPLELRKSLTLDNGKEFVGHTAFQLLGLKTYFCDSYSPGQKPLVEKINSMIHRIFPKKLDIKLLTKEKLIEIENILNNMPRKILGYKTPNEIWSENI